MALSFVKRLAGFAFVAVLAAPAAAQQLTLEDLDNMTDEQLAALPGEQLKQLLTFQTIQTGGLPASQPFFRGSPGTSSGSPSGFGAAWRDGFVGGGYQKGRGGTDYDGSMAFGFGLGNAKDAVGLEVVVASLGTFRSGLYERSAFSFKAHHAVSDNASIALGVENAFATGGGDDTDPTVFVAATRVLSFPESPFKQVTLSGGIGNGRFRFEKDLMADKSTINFFASAGATIHEQASVFADWGGQDLTVGLSLVPIKAFPIILTPAIADLTGQNGRDPRFSLGFGIGMRF
ncbi:MAG: hypothetical protein FJ363_12365 [Gemmatimonadetes bacterium]|nr:hypothetical protein [Gemmatimonadota bacterium]